MLSSRPHTVGGHTRRADGGVAPTERRRRQPDGPSHIARRPGAVIRRYAELVRAGEGNEHERLALLHEHQRRVRERVAELAACLELIDFKVGVYEGRLARGTAGRLWSVPTEPAEAS